MCLRHAGRWISFLPLACFLVPTLYAKLSLELTARKQVSFAKWQITLLIYIIMHSFDTDEGWTAKCLVFMSSSYYIYYILLNISLIFDRVSVNFKSHNCNCMQLLWCIYYIHVIKRNKLNWEEIKKLIILIKWRKTLFCEAFFLLSTYCRGGTSTSNSTTWKNACWTFSGSSSLLLPIFHFSRHQFIPLHQAHCFAVRQKLLTSQCPPSHQVLFCVLIVHDLFKY